MRVVYVVSPLLWMSVLLGSRQDLTLEHSREMTKVVDVLNYRTIHLITTILIHAVPAGSLIMFASGQGELAADAAGAKARNGAFTAALLAHLGTPGQTLEQMAVEVRNQVKEATGGQEPESHNRLNVAGLCLVPAQ